MSSYENYTKTSKNYDKTREPVGTEVIVGCLAMARTPLSEMVLLDAGCGTGNYSVALLPHVKKIEAVDVNPGMISVASRKLSGGNVSFHESRIDELPFDDESLDGAMINQVLHHLPDETSDGFPAHRATIREVSRVLKPGGVLTINTCSREQLSAGYWYYSLIPEATEELRSRYAPLEVLVEILEDCGFERRGRFAPTGATVQGESYFDPRGPLKEEWRDGDSAWSLASEAELEHALSRVRSIEEPEEYIARKDARRPEIGQVTVLYAVRV
ncbi:MAG: class I SAM-dependent methyltransferase [Rubrobacteraceae bacterium]